MRFPRGNAQRGRTKRALPEGDECSAVASLSQIQPAHDPGVVGLGTSGCLVNLLSVEIGVGCDAVELHTGMYANAKTQGAAERKMAELEAGRDIAIENKLIVHAGHGLTYRNIGGVAGIKGLCEFNIGHSIIARAVFVGIRQATEQMIELINEYGSQ